MRPTGPIAAAAVLALLAGCASTSATDPRDPWESLNRATFEFNDGVDRAVLKPAAEGYRAVLPDPVRAGVRNFFSNLRDPWIAFNQLLQGKVELALSDAWRFIANTTFGLGGIFDIATDMRMPKHNEDFGQTLAVWGFDSGPYLVLPILGPSSVRDGVGTVADAYVYLPYWLPEWLDVQHRVAWSNSLTALDFVNVRANLLDATNVLEQAALDRYAFVRNAYFQRRRNLIYDGNPPRERLDDGQSFDLDAAPPEDSAAAAPQRPPQVVEPKLPGNYSAVLSAAPVRVAAAP